ncbi:10463_t:CDS:1 [Paraglomus occultum]|uniref:10463_t:CDS:1 n=1 Tax=Paraglomus occultum TaxID=144539 RepID=A0A9N8ZFH3_9GLOM|nr:10463_t:CDS:1 [Paraglomus occultum]
MLRLTRIPACYELFAHKHVCKISGIHVSIQTRGLSLRSKLSPPRAGVLRTKAKLRSSRKKPSPVSDKTRGHIPARFKLLPIKSDVSLTKSGVSSAKRPKPEKLVKKMRDQLKKNATSAKETDKDTVVEEKKLLAKVKPFSVQKLMEKAEGVTFESMGLREEIYEAIRSGPLAHVTKLRPTEIQALAIPEILKHHKKHIMCAAETGSGKTLTYLIPIINKLKQEEADARAITDNKPTVDETVVGQSTMNTSFPDAELPNLSIQSSSPILQTRSLTSSPTTNAIMDFPYPDESFFAGVNLPQQIKSKHEPQSSIRRLRSPRAIVLLPSRELVNQIHSVAKQLSHIAKYRAVAITSHMPRWTVVRNLETPVDLVVATPAGILQYSKENVLSFVDAKYLVIDEADTMFGHGFEDEVREIVKNLKESAASQNRSYQVIIVSATLPKTVNEMLNTEFPWLTKITTPSLHKVLPTLTQTFIDMKSYNFNKHNAILEVLKQNHTDRTMIFCNTRPSARGVEAFLTSKRIPVIGLYGDVANREAKLNIFKDNPEEAKVLVCTDIASRGVDTTFVDHVILMDFPTTVVDYLHRVGRTARAGRVGKVTCFITKKNRELADRIRRNIRDGRVLS